MDLETENRLAALLMEEARRLRDQAEREGVGVYLRQPNIRGRPNSRFLTATVLGVEQANRAVEVNEMWRAREKERELDAKLKSREKDKDVRYGGKNPGDPHKKVSISRHEKEACRMSAYASSSKLGYDNDTFYSSDDGGLKDDEVEEFLCSRAKRGRGAIGSRMDEPGPYPWATSSDHDTGKLLADPDAREKEDWEHRILGPEKPSFIKSHKSPPEEVRDADDSKKKHRSKEEKKKRRRSKEEERSERKKNKEEEKKHKHRHHKRSRRCRSDSE